MKYSHYIKATLIVAAIVFIGIVYDSSKDKTASYFYIAMSYDQQMSMKHLPKSKENIKTAKSYFDKAHQGTPQEVNILYAYANFLYKYNLIDEAKNYYRMAFQLEKVKKRLYSILTAPYAVKEYQQAIDTSEIALILYPDDINILNELAWIYATAEETIYRNPQKAIRYAKKAVKLSDRKNPVILDTLAAAYHINSEHKKAVDVQKEALNMVDSEEDEFDYRKRLNTYAYALDQENKGKGMK